MSCTSIALKNIPRDCDPNVGGIKRVWLAVYQNNLFTLGDKTEGTGSTATVVGKWVTGIDSGATWYEYEFRKATGSMNSTLNVDDANGVNYVSTELSLIFSRMETEKRTAIAALAVAEVAAIVLDCNGKYWALGFDEPVTSTAGAGQTGTARGDANQYNITLTDVSRSYPYEVDPTVVVDTNGDVILN